MEYTGGCRCGAVRYSLPAQHAATRVCWCRDCQYFGAGSGIVKVFSKSALNVAEVRPNGVIVRAGTLDDPGRVAPTMTIWTASAPAWACFDDSLPQVPGQPPAAS